MFRVPRYLLKGHAISIVICCVITSIPVENYILYLNNPLGR